MSLRNVLLRVKSILPGAQMQYTCSFVNKPSIRSIYNHSGLFHPRRAPSAPVKSTSSITPDVISDKYKVFDDKDAVIIQHTSEELLADQFEEDADVDEFEGINLERGVNGVFEIDELVNILHQENAQDIYVSAVPSSIQYADYICIVTGRSLKHNIAIAEFIRKLFKRKRHPKDIIPKIEGETTKEWIALDLGNIILHIFRDEVREIYNLELLWSVGSEYDDQSKKYSQISEYIQKHSMYLDDLTPADER